MTTLDAIMEIEGGIQTEERLVECVQCLIDDGIVWRLQGSYGRLAKNLIEAGLCHAKK